MVNFIETNNLDGIDVDIEGSLLPFIGANYNRFVLELKDHLHAKGKAITAALMPISLDPIIVSSTLQAFDFINIMAYNASGLWNLSNPGPHSSFEFAEESLDFWMTTNTIPAHKLTLGIPFYGINFDPEIAASTTYGEIITEDTENAYVDNVDLIYYNGIPTVVKKTELAMEKVSGIMIWELGQDAFNELSLVRAVNQVLKAAPCNGKSISTYYADEDNDGYGNKEQPFEACEKPTGYVDNRTDADDTNSEIH
jgi:GH18 family chitinase